MKSALSDYGAFEVCAEQLPHMNSWGWFGPTKIRIEEAAFDESVRLAQIICDAMNEDENGQSNAT